MSYSGQLTDLGVAQAVASCPRLSELALLNLRNVGDDSLRAIAAQNRKLRGAIALRRLDVRWTAATEKGVQRLKSALPGCEVVHGGGRLQPSPLEYPLLS